MREVSHCLCYSCEHFECDTEMFLSPDELYKSLRDIVSRSALPDDIYKHGYVEVFIPIRQEMAGANRFGDRYVRMLRLMLPEGL